MSRNLKFKTLDNKITEVIVNKDVIFYPKKFIFLDCHSGTKKPD
jgi:hypothetical protein